MFRPVLLLSAAMFVTLLIAGNDRGQMRPGLARAVAGGEQIVRLERSFSPTVVAAPQPEPEGFAAALPPPVELIEAPKIASVPKEEPLPAEEPAAKPVFTLSALPGLGGDRATLDESAEPAEAAQSLYADPTDGGALNTAPGTARGDDIRIVSASSVNVRLGPSTGAEVVGKLYDGEAVRVIGTAGSEWAEVAIEGDGIRGYVAARFLEPAGY
ncbi:SH3 domain-containing protein [Pseudogemmobacter humi]|uniref:Bacterial SH3 domain protein n=1 Tax=Pseudogemmobacter humi TaxID=2483812 RepID=A0A3P5WVE1_9RHOB|nr:SH3 domain-containing protein [Pseudogemmobacter humi]VDC22456.1 Bacterial SH3 domain protein [Pseudogemmobacter humi]